VAGSRTLARGAAGGFVKRIDWYIGSTVVSATLLAWLVVVSLEALFAFLGELGDIGRGDYALSDAAAHILFTLPSRAYALFPMAALLGSLLGLGGLAAQSELDALRLAGCSPARLTAAVLKAGVAMLIVVVAIGEGWAPAAQRLAGGLRAAAIAAAAGMQQDFGFWVRDGQTLIRVGNSQVDGTLSDISIFELTGTMQLAAATSAGRAVHEPQGWTLLDARSSRFADDAIVLAHSAQVPWLTGLEPDLARLLTRDAQTLSLREMLQYMDYLQRNGNPDAAYRLAFWQRLSAPLATLVMLTLSVSLVLSRLGRQGTAQRVLAGVVVGLGFKLLAEVTAQAGLVYGAPPWLGALGPVLLVAGVAVLLLRRSA
jgi:lipopolysaccharide export system permease protein